MSRKLLINIAVADLNRSVEFFTRLGFAFDQKFTDDAATMMVVNDDAYFMLLTEARFAEFARKPVADAHQATEAYYCISAESRAEIDQLVNTALSSGGRPANDPQEHGSMYGWSFEDPDGHHWEVIWMDEASLDS